MLDHEMSAASAAQYLHEKLGDGRSYYSLLQDMRRHRRRSCIPFHKDGRGKAWYYKADLDTFVDEEQKRSLAKRHDYLVIREETGIGSWLPPEQRIEALH